MIVPHQIPTPMGTGNKCASQRQGHGKFIRAGDRFAESDGGEGRVPVRKGSYFEGVRTNFFTLNVAQSQPDPDNHRH
jgi:hypothetical protein